MNTLLCSPSTGVFPQNTQRTSFYAALPLMPKEWPDGVLGEGERQKTVGKRGKKISI